MSSWKNANKAYQKPHRERHQPESRKHLGLLEKHKDYKQRANDYNEKKAQLQYLHKRALDRNPDEFYYHMINSGVQENGEHRSKAKDVTLTPEQISLMQTQDYNYVASRRVMELRKVEKLQSELHLQEQEPVNRHTFFVDSVKDLKKFSLTNRLDTPAALLHRRHNRLRTSVLSKDIIPSSLTNPEKLQELVKQSRKSYKELEKRKERHEKLSVLQQKIEIKRTLKDSKKTIKQRVKPETPNSAPIYLWHQERKK